MRSNTFVRVKTRATTGTGANDCAILYQIALHGGLQSTERSGILRRRTGPPVAPDCLLIPCRAKDECDYSHTIQQHLQPVADICMNQ